MWHFFGLADLTAGLSDGETGDEGGLNIFSKSVTFRPRDGASADTNPCLELVELGELPTASPLFIVWRSW